MSKIPKIPLTLILLCLHIIYPLHCTSTSIHDLLKIQGLPSGLFPINVKNYTLDPYGLLEVHFNEPCEAMFESLVRFDSVVRANLSYGGLIGVQGLTQEELFLWLPVEDIIVNDPSSGLIVFNIGVAHKQLSLSIFEDPPICVPQCNVIFLSTFD
ncbi:hypothetical protein vseg_009039 [Gypsophila vaccaria]